MTFIFLEKKKALLLLVTYSLQDITQSIVKQLLLLGGHHIERMFLL